MAVKYTRAKPYFSDEDIKFIMNNIELILKSGQIGQGKYVSEFEEKFKDFVGTKYAIATSSCTAALEIAIKSLGIKNKKILVTTNTFMASVSSIILSGNEPVLVDIDENTLCMSYDDLVSKVDEDTAAVMLVHIAGLITPEYHKIKQFCVDKGLYLIEDAAHSPGASIYNEDKDERVMAGNLGDVACFSFFPTKVMTTGEGGMITTNIDRVDELSRIFRNHGSEQNVEALEVSSNYRMSEISAVLGISQLSNLEYSVRRRNEIAKIYDEGLSKIDGIKLLPRYDNILHSFWNYFFILDTDRDDFSEKLLNDFGIQSASAYYPPCHKQKAFIDKFKHGKFEVADDVLKKHISIPMHLKLTNDDVKHIIDCIKEILV